jgi:twitching motility protein PilT
MTHDPMPRDLMNRDLPDSDLSEDTAPAVSGDRESLHDGILATLSRSEALSDIHLVPGQPARSRENGHLQSMPGPIVDHARFDALLAALVGTERSAALRAGLSDSPGGAIDFSAQLGVHRLRCNLHRRDAGGVGLAMRRLRDQVPPLDALGLPPLLRSLVDRGRGLLLVTGPTGTGKSTSLAALSRHIVTARPVHLLTIEDPIEYRIDGGGDPAVPGQVTARELGADTADFAAAVRAALRQDPDVIVIGEIRDRATMHAALSAAETGHLVLATLHTPNASETIDRVLSFFAADEMGWARSVFANALIGVLSQALVRTRGGERRLLVYDLMINTPAVRQQVLQGTLGQLRAIMAQGRRDGHVQMSAMLVDRVRRGEIALEDARRIAHPVEEFEYLLRSAADAGARSDVRASARPGAGVGAGASEPLQTGRR